MYCCPSPNRTSVCAACKLDIMGMEILDCKSYLEPHRGWHMPATVLRSLNFRVSHEHVGRGCPSPSGEGGSALLALPFVRSGQRRAFYANYADWQTQTDYHSRAVRGLTSYSTGLPRRTQSGEPVCLCPRQNQ